MNSKKLLILFGFCSVWCTCILPPPTQAQFGARNTVPETVSACYRNSTAYNRYTRQPMHINNLIAIVRKIERKEPQWDMRRIARIIVNRYMFDGFEFNPTARPELQYNPTSLESIKTAMIKTFIPIQVEEIIPPGVLDNDELCSLHWMLSHSMNATVRNEELGINPFNYNSNPSNPNAGYNPNPYNANPTNNNNGNNPYSGQQQRGRRSIEDDLHDISNEDIGQSQNAEIDASQEQPAGGEIIPAVLHQPITGDDHGAGEEIPEYSNESKKDPPTILGRSVLTDLPTDLISDDAQKFARQVSTRDPTKSRRPIETGVVYTNWGSISAGRLLSGIAAALEPMTIPIGTGSPYPSSGFGTGSSGTGNGGSGYTGFGSNGGGSGNPFGTNNNNNNNNNNPFGPGSNPYPAQNQYGRKKRQAFQSITFQPLQNVHAATLAGDIGQAAMRNGKFHITQVPLPKGVWNDTICPREYILEPYPYSDKEIYMEDAALTYMTEAEVRGGMDGLILGTNIQRWSNAGLKLSELLEMYYSETGIAGEPQFRSCNRGSLFSGAIDRGVIQEQAKSFAYLYNNYTQSIPVETINDNPSVFLNPVNEVYNKMWGVASSVEGGDPACKRRQSTASSTVDTDDTLKFTEIKSRIYAVLDHTANYDEVMAQKRFIGQLANEINVSPQGSRLGVVDGSSGQILISPNLTDVGAILACNVLALPTQTKTVDLIRVLTNLRTEFQKLRDEEIRLNYESDLGIVVLVMVQGKKLDDGQKSGIRQLLQELNDNYGDVKMLFTSSKYQQSDFDGFLLNPARDFIRIQSTQNISDFADEFANEMRTKASHGRFSYLKCNTKQYNQDEEHKVATTFFVSPDNIQYYRLSPDYFYSAKDLRTRFTSDNGKVRVCFSQDEPFPTSRNGGHCRETTGNYVTPGNSQIDVEFGFSKPCGKHGNRNGCKPIFFSFTPTQYPSSGQSGLDCSIEGCQSPNQVKVTFTHWDMRCNSSLRHMLSIQLAFTTLIISLIFWNKTT